MKRQVKTFLYMFRFYFVGKRIVMKNKFNQISNSFSHHFKLNC